MARLIDRYTLTANAAYRGEVNPPLDQQVAFPRFGALVGRYVVPAGKKVTCAGLNLSAHNTTSIAAQAPGVTLNMGTVDVLYGGTLHWQARVLGSMVPLAPGGDGTQGPSINTSQQVNFGDGVTVPAGTALLFRVTPGVAIPMRWHVTALSTTGALTQDAAVVTTTTTANQTLLTYTPGSDWTLKGFVVSVETPAHVLGRMYVLFNGLPLFETPWLGMDNTATVPFDSDGNSVTGHGVLHFPMMGAEMYTGDSVEVYAQIWSDCDSFWEWSLIGDEVVTGGGGGNTYSRGRVVNAGAV